MARPPVPTAGLPFFGRRKEVEDVCRLWLRNRVTLLSGPAGVGKTSLLAACALEFDNRRDVHLLDKGQVSGGSSFPLGVLRKYNPYSLALLRSWSGEPGTRLAEVTLDDFIGQRARERDESVMILAAIDRADDLFAGPESRQQDRRRFFHDLAFALAEHPRLHLLISVRPDTRGRLRDALGSVVRCEDYELSPLDPEATRQAMVDTSFLPSDAAEDLLASIRTSQVTSAEGRREQCTAAVIEPVLLQAACANLRDTPREPRETRRSFTRFVFRREPHRPGDVDAALAEHCGRAIATVADVHAMPTALLRRWMIRAFSSPDGPAASNPDEFPHVPDAVARALEDRHVLRRSAGTLAAPGGGPGQSADPRQYQLISIRLAEPLQLSPENMSPLADPGAHLEAAERALTIGEFGLAEEYVAAALRAAPGKQFRLDAEASTLRGNLACERHELDEAEKHYRKAAEHFEAADDPGAVACLLAAVGRILVAQNRRSEAFDMLKAAISRDPASTSVIQDELNWTMEVLAGRVAEAPPFRISAD